MRPKRNNSRKKSSKELAKVLGAVELLSSQKLTLYLPDRDKSGKKIKNLQRWIHDAAQILALLGRGSTAMPPADVVWIRKSDILSQQELKESDVVKEKTTVLYTYLDEDRLRKNAHILRDFVCRFGAKTNQREVVIEFNNRFYKIEKFNS